MQYADFIWKKPFNAALEATFNNWNWSQIIVKNQPDFRFYTNTHCNAQMQ